MKALKFITFLTGYCRMIKMDIRIEIKTSLSSIETLADMVEIMQRYTYILSLRR